MERHDFPVRTDGRRRVCQTGRWSLSPTTGPEVLESVTCKPKLRVESSVVEEINSNLKLMQPQQARLEA